MKKILSALFLSLLSLPAFASYLCEQGNDKLDGQFTSTYPAEGVTLGAFVKMPVTGHPLQVDAYLTLGNSNTLNENLISLRSNTTANDYLATAIVTGTGSGANVDYDMGANWVAIVGKYVLDTERHTYVFDITHTNDTTSTRDVADSLKYVRLCLGMDNNADAAVSIAEVAIWDDDESDANITAFMTSTVVPTFSAGPTLGTPTTTTLPTTFTSTYTGNVKATACPDGTAGSLSQTKAGQCSGGGAAPASWTEAVVGGVGDTHTFTGLTSSTVYDLSFVITRTNGISGIDSGNLIGYWPLSASASPQLNLGVDADGDLTVSGATFDADQPNMTPDSTLGSIANATTASAAGPPTFDIAPSCALLDSDSYRCTYDADGTAATLWVCARTTITSARTAAQIEAGTGCVTATSEASTGASDSIDVNIGGGNPFPIYSIDLALEQGTSNYSTVNTQADKMLQAPAGRFFATVGSVGANSPCALFNAAVDPDIVAGDILRINNTTSPGSYAIAVSASCQFSYTGDTSRQSALNTDVYDVSAGAYHASDIDFWANDPAPVCTTNVVLKVFDEDTAIAGYDLDTDCSHPLGDQLTYTANVSLNPGLSLNGATGAITGTPNTENEAGLAIRYTGTDFAGQTNFVDHINYVIDTWTMPNCNATSPAVCQGLVQTAAPWRIDDPGIALGPYVCGAGQGFGNVAEQDPDAGVQLEEFDPIEIRLVGVILPDFTGMTEAQVIAALEALCP